VHQPDGAVFAGKTMKFKLGEREAAESATWQSGGVDILDLTASSTVQSRTGVLSDEPAGVSNASPQAGGVLASPARQPAPPYVLVGTASIDGILVPEGTIVTAWADGAQVPGAEAAVQAKPTASSAGALHPVGKALEPLGDNLVRLWKFDAATQAWAFYDPRSALADFNTVNQLASGEFYLILLDAGQSATLNGQQRNMFAGWNPVVW
jgi:hypothetical protein